jgi:hypothetical protein
MSELTSDTDSAFGNLLGIRGGLKSFMGLRIPSSLDMNSRKLRIATTAREMELSRRSLFRKCAT